VEFAQVDPGGFFRAPPGGVDLTKKSYRTCPKSCVLSKFVWELYIIFNEIVKATHVRSGAVYRLKIIVRTSSITDEFLGLIYIPVATL